MIHILREGFTFSDKGIFYRIFDEFTNLTEHNYFNRPFFFSYKVVFYLIIGSVESGDKKAPYNGSVDRHENENENEL